jgi:hypothetical protein
MGYPLPGPAIQPVSYQAMPGPAMPPPLPPLGPFPMDPSMGGLPNPFCAPPCCDECPCIPCVWVSAEYLLYWVKDQPIPFLITVGDPADPFPGAIGQPGTVVVQGAGNTYIGPGSGARASAGCWFGPDGLLGLEGNGFFLEKNNYDFVIQSDITGNPLIAIPFRTITGQERAVQLSVPGGAFPVLGRATYQTSTKLWGAESNLVGTLFRGPRLVFQVLAGARYIDLEEELELVAESTQAFLGNGVFVVTTDDFETRNVFYGGQVGARCAFVWGRFSVDFTGKCALGPNDQSINVFGITTQNITPAGGPTVQTLFPGGIFAQPTNIGHFRRSDTTVVAEGLAHVNWDVCSWCRLILGYNFLWLDKTARPGEAIDRTLDLPPVNPVLVGGPLGVGPLRPLPTSTRSEFWAHGLSAGFELRY